MDIRTVRHTIWKGVGDMKLYYREVEKPNDEVIDEEKTASSTVDSN